MCWSRRCGYYVFTFINHRTSDTDTENTIKDTHHTTHNFSKYTLRIPNTFVQISLLLRKCLNLALMAQLAWSDTAFIS